MSFFKEGDIIQTTLRSFSELPIASVSYSLEQQSPVIKVHHPEMGIKKLPMHYYKIDSLDLLGEKVSYNQKIKYYVKSVSCLLKEGWERTDKGGLKKGKSYYKFTKKKIAFCGQVRTGIVKINPKFKTCIQDEETGWRFDENMLKYLITDIYDYENTYKEISHVDVEGRQDGVFRVGKYTFRNNDCMELMQELLKFHKWV